MTLNLCLGELYFLTFWSVPGAGPRWSPDRDKSLAIVHRRYELFSTSKRRPAEINTPIQRGMGTTVSILWSSSLAWAGDCRLELETKAHIVFTIMEKAFSWLKAATTVFKFKNIYYTILNVCLPTESRNEIGLGQVALRIFAKQPANPLWPLLCLCMVSKCLA